VDGSAAASGDHLCGGLELRVLTLDEARGLEFDAVLILEPSEFLSHRTVKGALYTSLTRANKQLVIVHTGDLPRELRTATKSST